MVKIVTREPLTQLNETVITAIAMYERAPEDRLFLLIALNGCRKIRFLKKLVEQAVVWSWVVHQHPFLTPDRRHPIAHESTHLTVFAFAGA